MKNRRRRARSIVSELVGDVRIRASTRGFEEHRAECGKFRGRAQDSERVGFAAGRGARPERRGGQFTQSRAELDAQSDARNRIGDWSRAVRFSAHGE